MVNNIINSAKCMIYTNLEILTPYITTQIMDLPVPIDEKFIDLVIWEDWKNVNLNFKDAHSTLFNAHAIYIWAKHVWHNLVPPEKSLTTWQFFHNSIANHDNLNIQGLNMVFMCSSCLQNVETKNHLFLDCTYTMRYLY